MAAGKQIKTTHKRLRLKRNRKIRQGAGYNHNR